MTEPVGSISSVGTLDYGMTHVPGGMEWDCRRLHHAKRPAIYNLRIVNFCNFSFAVFGLWVRAGNETQKVKLRLRGDDCMFSFRKLSWEGVAA